MKGLGVECVEILTHVLRRSLNPTPGTSPKITYFYLRLTSLGWDVRRVRWDDWLELGNDDARQGGLPSPRVRMRCCAQYALAFRARSCSFAGL